MPSFSFKLGFECWSCFLVQDDDLDVEDDEEIEDKTIKPTDMIIVTLHNNGSYNYLEASICQLLMMFTSKQVIRSVLC